ncbi:MAG: ribonuclease HII [Candidatus Omnitrophota bacterium]
MPLRSPRALFAFDRRFRRRRRDLKIAGTDEAGRGPLAGPVVAAAVLFLPGAKIPGLNDSKKLSASRREKLFHAICAQAEVGLGIVDEIEIDRLNILQASRLAMKKAVLALSRTPDLVLVDGRDILDLEIRQEALVRGDARSASIAAASIIAKVTRDAWMTRLDSLYPGYGFKRHKGYPTADHRRRLLETGPSPVHRRSFAPVREAEKAFAPNPGGILVG